MLPASSFVVRCSQTCSKLHCKVDYAARCCFCCITSYRFDCKCRIRAPVVVVVILSIVVEAVAFLFRYFIHWKEAPRDDVRLEVENGKVVCETWQWGVCLSVCLDNGDCLPIELIVKKYLFDALQVNIVFLPLSFLCFIERTYQKFNFLCLALSLTLWPLSESRNVRK